MKNYAEELAYWYFRFNGFFVLPNYVTHPVERVNGEGYSDTDLIAIKPRGVRELVGLQTNNEYSRFLRESIPDLTTKKTIGIICEVKAGADPDGGVDDKNIRAHLDRLGIPVGAVVTLNDQRDPQIPRGLIYRDRNISVYRFICKRDDNDFMQNDLSWGLLTINTILKFIVNHRFENYNVKTTGWHQYDSSLIQFLLRHKNLIRFPNE